MACGCQAILLNEDVMMMTWNKAFAVLVGHSHPSVLVTVDTFQADLVLAEQMIAMPWSLHSLRTLRLGWAKEYLLYFKLLINVGVSMLNLNL